MTANVNGDPWIAGYEWGETEVFPNGSFSGLSVGGYSVFLDAKVPLTPGGKYTIGSEINAFVLGDSLAAWDTFASDDSLGVLTISSLDDQRGRGTFYAVVPPSFNASAPLVIENGKFSVVMNPNEQIPTVLLEPATATRRTRRAALIATSMAVLP